MQKKALLLEHFFKKGQPMTLSTTINFFILSQDGGIQTNLNHIRRYHDLGYTHLDAILIGADSPTSPIMSDGEEWRSFAHTVREEADKLGISFIQAHLPYYNNFCTEPILPRREEAITRVLEVCGILGVKWAVNHPGTVQKTTDYAAKSKKACIEYFSPQIETAKKHGVGFAIENLFDSGGNRSYCGTVEELIDLVDSFKDDSVGICWDFGHGNLMYPDQTEPLKQIGSRLKMTHVHDNNGQSDQHLPPFSGNIDWPAVVRALREIGYTGAFSFEVVNRTFKHSEALGMSEWAHVKKIGEFLLG